MLLMPVQPSFSTVPCKSLYLSRNLLLPLHMVRSQISLAPFQLPKVCASLIRIPRLGFRSGHRQRSFCQLFLLRARHPSVFRFRSVLTPHFPASAGFRDNPDTFFTLCAKTAFLYLPHSKPLPTSSKTRILVKLAKSVAWENSAKRRQGGTLLREFRPIPSTLFHRTMPRYRYYPATGLFRVPVATFPFCNFRLSSSSSHPSKLSSSLPKGFPA
jgi:hypothetical protein